MTVGVERCQADLFKGSAFVRERLAVESVFSVLEREGRRLFPEAMFDDLFSSRGRRSAAPSPRRTQTQNRMSSAVLCHVKGLGSLFQLSVQALMESLRSVTEVWAPRRSHLVVSSENQRSTRFIQEL